MLSLLLPILNQSKSATHELQCAAELRDSIVSVLMYSDANRERWPTVFSYNAISETWDGPGGLALYGDQVLGGQSGYWAYALSDSHLRPFPLLACPANRELGIQLELAAQDHGAAAHELVYPLDRIMSHALFVEPSWCRQDQPEWQESALDTGLVSSTRFPSSKAAIFDKSAFHDPRFVSVDYPSFPPPFKTTVVAVDTSAGLRNTGDAIPPILIGEPLDESSAALRRAVSYYRLTRDGWLGRDW